MSCGPRLVPSPSRLTDEPETSFGPRLGPSPSPSRLADEPETSLGPSQYRCLSKSPSHPGRPRTRIPWCPVRSRTSGESARRGRLKACGSVAGVCRAWWSSRRGRWGGQSGSQSGSGSQGGRGCRHRRRTGRKISAGGVRLELATLHRIGGSMEAVASRRHVTMPALRLLTLNCWYLVPALRCPPPADRPQGPQVCRQETRPAHRRNHRLPRPLYPRHHRPPGDLGLR